MDAAVGTQVGEGAPTHTHLCPLAEIFGHAPLPFGAISGKLELDERRHMDAGQMFVLMDSDYYDPGPYPRRTYDLHCPGCGRYCKSMGAQYDHRNCLWVTTSCGKCGVVETPWG